MRIKYLVLIAIAVLLTIVVIQNTHEVAISLLFWDVSVTLIVLIISVFVVGFTAGFLAAKLNSRKRNRDSSEKSGTKSGLKWYREKGSK